MRWLWPRYFFRGMLKWGWAGTCYSPTPEDDVEFKEEWDEEWRCY